MHTRAALLACGLALGAVADSLARDAVEPLPAPVARDVLPRAGLGEWVVRTQLVWDASARSLARRELRAWRNIPGGELDFLWLPHTPGLPGHGRIEGEGRLVWRERDAATDDRDAVVGVYSGSLVDGKANGHGSYTHRSGFTYEGQWVDGLMHGPGRLRSPVGSEFTGTFEHGRPRGDARLVDAFGEVFDGPLEAPGDAHASAPQVRFARYAQHGAVRIGVFVAPPQPVEEPWLAHAVEYAGDSRADGLVVAPTDRDFLRVWLGGESDRDVLVPTGMPIFRKAYGSEPVELRIAVRNDSARGLRIAGARLRVERSVPALNPLVDVSFMLGANGCQGEWEGVRAAVTDYGWGRIDDSTVTLRLGDRASPSQAVAEQRLGPVDGDLDGGDASAAFARLGVDRDFFQAIRSCAVRSLGFSMEDTWDERRLADVVVPAVKRCLGDLRRAGRLGDAAPHLTLDEGPFLVPSVDYVATYAYTWTDHAGRTRSSSRVYPRRLELGSLVDCMGAEAGEAEPFFGNKIELRARGENYQLGVPLRAQVKAGEERSWSVLVTAPQSSVHSFVFELDVGGERLSSRPVALTYFRGNMQRLYGYAGREDPPPGTWIQMASRSSRPEAIQVACWYAKRLSDVAVYRAANGWYAIVTGPVPPAEARVRAERYKRGGVIPQDALITDGERFIEGVHFDLSCTQ